MSIQSEINRLKNNVAATYAAMEEQGATMPTQQNSANMAATARTIPTGGGGGTTVQADLAVNDPSNARYVKNRTHWKEVFDGPEGEVISETEVSFTSNIKTVTGAMSDGIQVGGLYVVSWNGTDYECVGKSGSDGNYIGNGSFMNAGSITFEDTGEPFCVLLFGGTYYQLWKADTTAETITVKVVGKKETVWHKLDGGYLPEGVPYVETSVVEFVPETTMEVEPGAETPLSYIVDVKVGDTVTVKWNGVEYVCTAVQFPSPDMPFPCIGDIDMLTTSAPTGAAPFIMIFLDAETATAMGAGTVLMSLDESVSVTLSISGESKTVHKMAAELLPDGVPYAEPFDDVIIPSWPVNSQDMEIYMAVTDPVGKVVPGNVYKVNWGGTSYECVARYNADGDSYLLGNGKNNLVEMRDGVATDHPFTIAILGPASTLGAAGVTYLIKADSDPENYEFSVVGSLKVQKINEHCLPDNFAPLFVKLSGNNTDGYTTDISFDVALSAFRKGRIVFIESGGEIWQLNSTTDSHMSFYCFYFQEKFVDYKTIYWHGTGITLTSKRLQIVETTT